MSKQGEGVTNPTRQELLELVSQLVEVSGGKLRLAHREQAKSRRPKKDAGHFLKLNDKRLGRDIETYDFMAEALGWGEVLVMFLEEIVLPLKNTAPVSYHKASKSLMKIGKRVYPSRLLPRWKELFI